MPKANTTAGLVYEVGGQTSTAREYWKKAGADARILASISHNSPAVLARSNYLLLSGQDESVALQAADRTQCNSQVAVDYAMSVYRRAASQEVQSALRWLDDVATTDPINPYVPIARMVLLSEMGDAGRMRARATFDAFLVQFDEPVYRLCAAVVLVLSGHSDEMRSVCDGLRGKRFPMPLGDVYSAICDQLSGSPLSVADVLRLAQNDRTLRCEACYFLGLGLLAAGDRESALRLFRDGATRFRYPGYPTTPLCMAFVARLEKDPTWPPWIKGKK